MLALFKLLFCVSFENNKIRILSCIDVIDLPAVEVIVVTNYIQTISDMDTNNKDT